MMERYLSFHVPAEEPGYLVEFRTDANYGVTISIRRPPDNALYASLRLEGYLVDIFEGWVSLGLAYDFGLLKADEGRVNLLLIEILGRFYMIFGDEEEIAKDDGAIHELSLTRLDMLELTDLFNSARSHHVAQTH